MGATILVTGSSTGFGRLTVETLARQGYTVFAGIRDISGKNQPVRDELRALAENEHLELDVVELDVSNDPSVDAAVQHIVAATRPPAAAVKTPGVSSSRPPPAPLRAQAPAFLTPTVLGVRRVNRAVRPQMRARGSGLLLQIGSISGRIGLPFLGLYGATKFTLEGLSESYRYELAPFGIDAAILEPGTYPTTISVNRQVAADAERLALYQAGLDAFTAPFYGENRSATPPDPQEVADVVARVIAQPAGKRPLRTIVATVAQRQAPQALNDAAIRAMHSFLEALHIPGAALAFQGEQEEVRKQ